MIILALVYTRNWASVGCSTHIPVSQNLKLAPFPCYSSALISSSKFGNFTPFPLFSDNSPNLGNSLYPKKLWTFLKNYRLQTKMTNISHHCHTGRTSPFYVLQRGDEPEDHPPPHTVPHCYFLFLSGDYKSPWTQCIPHLLLSRQWEHVIIWLDVELY